MNAQVITTEYTGEFAVQPWAAAVRTAADASAAASADAASAAVGFVPDRPIREAKARDRGASAVEWVIITGIVIGIVLVVGGIIATTLKDKATKTGDDITNATVSGN